MTCQLGSFNYQSNIPSWNIRCVPRSRLKLVSRERKMMMLMLSRKMLMLRRRMLRRKTDEARTQTYTLCEPAQSKCTSTCHKSRTIRKFTGNNAADQSEEHPDQAPAFTPTVRTPQCGQTVWGIKRQTATACKHVTSGLLDLSLARAHGHPGTTRSTGTRAHGHNPDPRAHGHTGTTLIPGHTGTRAKPTREPTSSGDVDVGSCG